MAAKQGQGKRRGKRAVRLALWMLAFLLIGAGSYCAAAWYYGGVGARHQGSAAGMGSGTGEAGGAAGMGSGTGAAEGGGKPAEGELPGRVLNLIYGVSQKDGEITALILEAWDREGGSLRYVTIPVDTGYQMSAKLYRELTAYEPNLPQIMRLFRLYGYYGEERAFSDGTRIVGELLGTEIPYYTVLPTKVLKQYFRQTKKGKWKWKQATAELAGEGATGRQERLEALYEVMETNLPLESRLACLGDVATGGAEFYLIPGVRQNAGYVPDSLGIYETMAEIVK